jgi:HSP20 family protein
MWLWNPARELSELEDEMRGLFSGVSGTVHTLPPVNIWTNDNDVLVTAELPGVQAEDLEITVLGDELTLHGKRNPLELKNEENFHRRERMHGEFQRTVRMPFRVDSEKVDANIQKGILHIKLSRAEEDKPRKIAIKAA